MTDVFVVGSINQDFVLGVERRPEPGETVTDAELGLYSGGKGANQAAAAALLGSRTAMLGKVGEDGFGRDLTSELAATGIDTALIQEVSDTPTGTAFITVTPDGQNAIVVSPGANRALVPKDVAAAAGVISRSRVLLAQMEVPPETSFCAIRAAAAAGTRAVLNLAPSRALPPDVAECLDPLVVNESEASFLLCERVAGIDSALDAASKLLLSGTRSAVLTLGGAGAVFADGAVVEHVPAPEVPVVDTTAAGDAFVGALVGRLAAGDVLPEAVRYAVRAGSAAVTKRGARDSLPTPEEVDGI